MTTKSTVNSTTVASLSYHFKQEVSTEKCSQWLEKQSTMSLGDSESITGTGSDDLDDGTSSMITDDCTESVGGDSTTWLVPNKVKDSNQVVWNDKTMLVGEYQNSSKVVAEVNTIFNKNKNIYSNVKINKSKKVHLGNVTYINGPVYIGQGQQPAREFENTEGTLEANFEVTKRFRMVNRMNWLAQPPMEEKIIFKRSAKYAIVCKYRGQDKKCRFLCIYERLDKIFRGSKESTGDLLWQNRLEENFE